MLFQKINQFASLKSHPKCYSSSLRDFVAAMHTIRVYGNMAAHSPASLPGREVCLATVERYMNLKADYENKSKT